MPELSDLPVTDPSNDLLGMARRAEGLARWLSRVPLPYTVGVYGAWGEGKTTFAGLLAHYLTEGRWAGRRFVPFSAWPYVTADAVWRALLEKIARCVYAIDDRNSEDTDQRVSVRERIQRNMRTPVFGDANASHDNPKMQAYEDLMASLGRATALAERRSRDAEATRRMSALAGALLDVATTVTSTMDPLRRLFGSASDSSGARAKAERSVASVEEIRRSVHQLFREASNPRTVILVDDLDRCLPEVALDVLETLKIFLSESANAGAECLFIVAVDADLLTRGLRSRLGGEEAEAAAARAYLEKVIQFGLPMSHARDARPHRLVAGYFPEWSGSIDLLDIATRTNPRRVIQQCDLLSYGYSLLEEEG